MRRALGLVRTVVELLAVQGLLLLTTLETVLRGVRLVSAKFFAIDSGFARVRLTLLRFAVFVEVDNITHEVDSPRCIGLYGVETDPPHLVTLVSFSAKVDGVNSIDKSRQMVTC